jgi:ribose 5-phosphate isomerase B
MTKIFVASDHAGFELKKALIEARKDLQWHDLGPADTTSVDYPDYADLVAQALKESPKDIGVLICGSGQGMAIRANRFSFIRAALCVTPDMAEMARAHNDANVLALGGRQISVTMAMKILDKFLQTPFEGGRHERRVKKLSKNC